MTTQLDKTSALGWLERWDDQQATFFVDREERFDVIVDVVQSTVQRPDPLVVDLGVGPGSLAHRLLQRIPDATVIGVDMDPLLLALAEAAYSDEGLRVRGVNLGEQGWSDRLGADRAVDAFVSTTALHWLPADGFRAVVAEAVHHLAPGGVFVDGDHFYDDPKDRSGLDAIRTAVAAAAADRAGRSQGEGWEEWWDAVAEAPELAALVQERTRAHLQPGEERRRQRPASLSEVYAALTDSGCAEAGPVWQNGDDFVVVGVSDRSRLSTGHERRTP